MGTLNIIIVGGSVAGCMAAILLGRAGHHVNVYERSASGLIGRGGGVTTSRTVLQELISNDILDVDFPSTEFTKLRLSKTSDKDPYLGHCPLVPALDMHCVNWSGLWENMRKRVPDENYHRGQQVTDANQTSDGKVRLSFADGATREADLVLFADGYQSLGRSLIFPEVSLNYRDYAVWRGVVPDNEMDDLTPLENHPRYSMRTIKGSFVSFVVPNRNGPVEPGNRTINWAAYLPLPEDDLAGFMRDSEGKTRRGSIPPGSMRAEEDEKLKALMRSELPEYYSGVTDRSRNNQIQLIYTNDLPAYSKGRIGLIGDAGVVVQPLTGAGLFKGYSNVRDLVEVLKDTSDIPTALDRWSKEQVRIAHRMLKLGEELEDAFIWNTIDLESAEAKQCENWWRDAVEIPDEFSYFAS